MAWCGVGQAAGVKNGFRMGHLGVENHILTFEVSLRWCGGGFVLLAPSGVPENHSSTISSTSPNDW